MKQSVKIILGTLAVAAFLFVSCAPKGQVFSSDTTNLIEEISPGRIGRLDPVVVRFIAPVLHPEALAKAARLSGGVAGAWNMTDSRTAEFTPSVPLKSGSSFVLSFDSGLLAGKKAGMEGFNATFEVNPASFNFIPDGLYADETSAGSFSFSGTVATDIPLTTDALRGAVSASLASAGAGRKLELTWETSGESMVHRFTVTGINRTDSAQTLRLTWNGKASGAKISGEKDWLVPANSDFTVLEIGSSDPSCIEVRFSDSLDKTQDFRGFVQTGTAVNVRYSVDSNVLRVYNTDGWKADTPIKVLEGIKSFDGKALTREASATISADWEIPEVRFPDAGVILPPTQGVTVTIETKNLKGLIVEAFLVYGDNMLQFLQVNELDGLHELRRVGEPVWSSSFDFNWTADMKNRFVPRGLDLSPLVKKYKDGMIQLRVTFRERHIMYECTDNHEDFSDLPMPADEIPVDRYSNSEFSYWSYWGDDMDWETRNTFWSYRGDPCHPAFYLYDYNSDILARKNVLVSDLGVMLKMDTDGRYAITVASIASAMPVVGADIAIHTYAQKIIASGKTDAKGMITLTPPVGQEAYFVTAKANGQQTFLRINNGTALNVSHFPIDGEKPQKGVKGFLYAERGVWRPGDDIHLVFVLQDLAKKLPVDFPITFELQDPQGRVASKETYTKSVDGFFKIDTKTGAEDPTGNWIARVRAGGQTWNKTLKIEAIVPNRLSISLKTDKAWLSSRSNAFTLAGAWLHGAPAPGLTADISATFYPAATTYDGYSDYTFINPERTVESERMTVWEGKLGTDSKASINLNLNAGSNLPGKLTAQLVTRIFEPSGMFSIEQNAWQFSPYDRYVGIRLPKGDASRGMLLTDTKHKVDIAVLDPEGKPYTTDVSVNLSVYELEWKWWWEKDALADASYASSRHANLITSGTVTAKGGKATWEMEVKYPEWGRYLVVAEDRSGGHSAAKIVYIDWPGWAGRSQEAGSGSASMLTMTADKTGYKTGETALVSFPSGAGGRALVAIEKDGKLLGQEWIDTAQGTTVYKLPLKSEMAPNVYVHISLLQKHMQTANSLPIRLYGVLPVMVEDPATRLVPVISAPEKFEPGKKASVTVGEQSGRAMTYTIAVVDEGLLGLTRFGVPNPWNEFYKKEASRISSWDIYKYVINAFGGKLETLLSVGGSEDGMNGANKKAERFKPVVRFFGPFRLEAGKQAATTFDMPQYVGAVRVMVVAGRDGAYGSAEKTVPVKSDLMILSTLPRTLGVGETIDIPVTVFNGKDTTQTVRVTLATKGSVSLKMSKEMTIEPFADRTVSFLVHTPTAGMLTFTSTAEGISGGAQPPARAESITEIDVLSRGSPTVSIKDFTLAPGEKFTGTVMSPGEKGSKTISVELSTMPVIDFKTRTRYLIQYPHGCIEQITSGGFPQLYIPEVIDVTAEETERIKHNIQSVLDRYSSYQTASGGFGYWPGNQDANEWGTNYAGHFMNEARKAGYTVNADLYAAWLGYQQDKARNWSPDRDKYGYETQAYRLYTLALSGNADIASMNRLASLRDLTSNGRWLLAAAYTIAGQRQTAANLAIWDGAQLPEYRDTGWTWGSNTRDSAIILHTLTLMNDTAHMKELIPVVAERFASGAWYSTHETAWMLIALVPHYRSFDAKPATWSINWADGSETGEIKKSSAMRERKAEDTDTQPVAVTNTGAKIIYGRIITRGLLPAGNEKAVEENLGLSVRYYDADGKYLDPASITKGMSFEIRLNINNKTRKDLKNIAISLPVPTCWEFANDRVGSDSDNSSAAFTYQDIRDTHVYTYLDLDSLASKQLVFHATAAYGGEYYLPAITAEAMYDASYRAVLPGKYVGRPDSE